VKFLSYIFIALGLAGQLMAAPLSEKDGGNVDATTTNRQKTVLDCVRQTKRVIHSLFGMAIICKWLMLTEFTLWSGMSLPGLEAMLLQPVSAKSMLRAAPGLMIPICFSYMPKNTHGVTLMALSAAYLLGGALSLKERYQGRHKSPADDASNPVIMTRQAKALQWVRQLKNLSFLLGSIINVTPFVTLKGVTKSSFCLGMALTGLEVLLAQPISVKHFLNSVPGIVLPLEVILINNKKAGFLCLSSAFLSSLGSMFFLLKDGYHGLGTLRTSDAKTS
jgi:hypothetical protein